MTIEALNCILLFQVEEALEAMKGTGAVLLFHAEAELPDLNEDPKSDPGLYSTFLESRPPGMELAAIRTVISVCRKTRVPCHIVHLSAAEALPMIRGQCESLQISTFPRPPNRNKGNSELSTFPVSTFKLEHE